MHKMGDQRDALAVHVLFTRVVKVKLFQGVGLVADGEGASGSVIHLNSVAVVDDVQRYGLVVQFQGGEIRGLGMRDIYGRLRLAQRTRSIRWIELTPVRRIFRAGVVPVRRVGFLSGAEGGQDQQAQDRSKQNSAAEGMRIHRSFPSERFKPDFLFCFANSTITPVEFSDATVKGGPFQNVTKRL